MTRTALIFAMTIAAAAAAAPAAQAGDEAFTLRRVPESAFEAAPGAASQASPSWLDDGVSTSEPASDLSMRRAVLYSLVLPGWGDYYAGYKYRARYFFIAEATAWTSFAVFRIQANRDEQRYKDFAVQFAGVTSTGHSDDFYVEVREWDSSAEYEAYIKAQGRAELYPDVSADALDRYYTDNRVSDFEPWAWDSFDRRLQYAGLRSASKNAYRRSHFAIAAAAVNRVVSAIFAYQAVKSRRGELSSNEKRYHIDLSPPPRYADAYDAAVSIVRTF
jgi:hypothetical protein